MAKQKSVSFSEFEKVLVMDDFLLDTERIIQKMLAKSLKKEAARNFPGLYSLLTQREIRHLLTSLPPKAKARLKGAQVRGRFRVTTKEDDNTARSFIHTDPKQVVLLIYLSQPPDRKEGYGTSFYRHLALKRKKILHSLPPNLKWKQDVIQVQHSFNEKAWKKWKFVEMRKNRAVLFSGDLFHSSTKKYFGHDIQTGRMTLELYFSE